MTTLDANELMERIRRARNWAQQLEELGFKGDSDTPTENLARAVNGAAFKAVRMVLDEILEPGSQEVPD
jgi:hypothetical protein